MPHFRVAYSSVFHEDYGYDHDIILESGYVYLYAEDARTARALVAQYIPIEQTYHRQGIGVARVAEELSSIPPYGESNDRVMHWLFSTGQVKDAHAAFNNNPQYDKDKWTGFSTQASSIEVGNRTIINVRTFPNKK